MNEIREKIAKVQHDQWSGWMEYLFSKCKGSDTGYFIPKVFVERWERQMRTPYEELTDKEQDSDRIEADKLLSLILQLHEEKTLELIDSELKTEWYYEQLSRLHKQLQEMKEV